MATSFKADISETEPFFWIFYYVSEIYVMFGKYKKKDQSHSLSVTETINFERDTYLSVQKCVFHATHGQITC